MAPGETGAEGGQQLGAVWGLETTVGQMLSLAVQVCMLVVCPVIHLPRCRGTMAAQATLESMGFWGLAPPTLSRHSVDRVKQWCMLDRAVLSQCHVGVTASFHCHVVMMPATANILQVAHDGAVSNASELSQAACAIRYLFHALVHQGSSMGLIVSSKQG